MNGARLVGVAAPLLFLLAAVILAGYLACQATARRLARYLRAYADQLESLDCLRQEPPGLRHAADLIDPRNRRRKR